MHKPHDLVGANGSDAVNAFIHQSPESRTNVDTQAHTDSVKAQDRGGYAGYVTTAPYTASMQAANDRDRAILLLKDIRQRVRGIQQVLEGYDLRLGTGGDLASFRRQIEERLAWCLLAREDADAS